jgi:uncharacterized membrane protein
MEVKQLIDQFGPLEFFSELHPLFVHFPVGLFSIVVVFAFLPKSKNRDYQLAIQYLLGIGAFFSLLSCISGYFLAESQNKQSAIFTSHQWLGIATFILFSAAFFYPKWQKISIGLGGIVLLFTLYFGTMLTHGSFLKWKEKVVQQINEIISKPVEKKDKDTVKKIVSLPDTPLKVEEQASYAAVTEPMIKELKSQGIIAQVMDPTTQQLFINFVNVKQVEPTMFEVLYPIKDQIAGFRITNLVLNQEAMRSLFQFKNVEILQLSNAHLTDELVGLILQLPKLQQLNLYGNPVTDQTAMALHNVFSLKKVYVWQTNISPLALNELQKARPQLQIEGGSQLLTKPDSLKK